MSMSGSKVVMLVAAVVLLVAVLTGCGAQHYLKDADRETQAVLRRKQESVLGKARAVRLRTPAWEEIDALKDQPPHALGDQVAAIKQAGIDGDEPQTITLSRALQIAELLNRTYQTRKEVLYLAALDLTLDRFSFRSHWFAALSGAWSKGADGEETIEGDGSLGFSRLLSAGGAIGLSITTDALRYLTGSPRPGSSSTLALSFVQPLWRGAGRRVAREGLTQAERDAVYAVRAFARFQQTFAVQIAAAYYRVLQQKDAVGNAENNYNNLVRARERTEALSDAGRLPRFQVDQARQDELSARDAWLRSQERYESLLDDFKIDLGLPVEAPLVLADEEIDLIRNRGLLEPSISLEEAIGIAERYRFDYLTTADQVADAARKAIVARDGLGPDLDLTAQATLVSSDRKPLKFRGNRVAYGAGLDLDLPLDRKAERNSFRRSLITFERARRDLSLATDNLKRDVRSAWRGLREARASYGIQEISLRLARQRVDSVNVLIEAGRASTRDLLEAQRALVLAQNALTNVLIDHQVRLLEFWRDTGLLRVDENGIRRHGLNEPENKG